MTGVDEKIIFEHKEVFSDKSFVITTVFSGDKCVTFRHFGKRGGLKATITIPCHILKNATRQIDDEEYSQWLSKNEK